MKKSLFFMFASLTLCIFGQELRLDASKIITETIDGGGTLHLDGKFALKDIKPWFIVRFTDIAGKTLSDFRFDSQKFYIPQLGRLEKYAESIDPVQEFKLTVEMAAGGTCYLILNNIPLTSYSFPGNVLPKKISLIPFGGFKPVFAKVTWDGKAPPQRVRIFAPEKKAQGVIAAKLPQGSFELKYKFKVEMLTDQPGHFSIQLTPDKKGNPGIQLVFWKKGFQMISGKNSKWLYDFKTPIADGKWHEFKLRHTDEDFWETWFDDQSSGSFDVDLQTDKIVFGAYSGWLFEAENITIETITNGDNQ